MGDFVCWQSTQVCMSLFVCETDVQRRVLLLELVRLIKTQSSAGTTPAETQRTHTHTAGWILMTHSGSYTPLIQGQILHENTSLQSSLQLQWNWSQNKSPAGHYAVHEELFFFMIWYRASLCGCPLWEIIIFCSPTRNYNISRLFYPPAFTTFQSEWSLSRTHIFNMQHKLVFYDKFPENTRRRRKKIFSEILQNSQALQNETHCSRTRIKLSTLQLDSHLTTGSVPIK